MASLDAAHNLVLERLRRWPGQRVTVIGFTPAAAWAASSWMAAMAGSVSIASALAATRLSLRLARA